MERILYSLSITSQYTGPAGMYYCKPCMMKVLTEIINEAESLNLIE